MQKQKSVSKKEEGFIEQAIHDIPIKFYLRDVMQVIVGATILAVPVGFTEEAWTLGETLPLGNVISLFILSIVFIGLFTYYNYYRRTMKTHWYDCTKRVITTYLISFLVVALLLTVIHKAPWQVDNLLALKRSIIVAFPASMSAAVADMIK